VNPGRRRMAPVFTRVIAAVAIVGAIASHSTGVDAQESYQRISGEGSSWAANAIDAMRVNVKQFGITVDYNPSGSSAGRKNWLNGTVDFAASDIPFQFQPEDGSAPERPAPGSYAYMPVTAGGTAFMYNLKINGKRVTNLRLSGQNIAKIFTGAITNWNDPAIQADNPGLTMPGRTIVPVIRSDGSGSSAQFTLWMIKQYPDIWNDYCNRSGRAPACGFTSFYPSIGGMIAQSGDLGVAGYVSQGFAEGAIGYVNYSYALGVQFPVAKMLNAAGYYTEPTPDNVAVSLLQARINMDESKPDVYLTQNLDGVYVDTDARNYPLSYYSYFILPTKVIGQFNEAKGRTLGAFAYYAMCQAQQQSASLGYSPMPINLVEASFDQIRKIPGVVVQDIDIRSCNNPTFSTDGTNLLADNAPQPQACDKQGPSQCPNGTGGLKNVPTATAGPPPSDGGANTTAAPTTAPPSGGSGGSSSGSGAGGGGASGSGSGGGTGGGSGGGTGGSSGSGGSTTGRNNTSGTGTGGRASGGSGSAATTAATSSGGGATNGGGGATGPVATAATGAPAGAGGTDGSSGAPTGGETPSETTCDPDTGQCGQAPSADHGAGGDNSASAANDGGGASAQQLVAAAPLPQTIDGRSGWGTSQALIVIVILLTLALVLVPAAAWHYFSRSDPS
jgi:phosphate ABC transporter phosphate-binding protein